MTVRFEGRKRSVLRAVIRDHIHTALPVGSEKIARKYRLDVSPATVRNIMARLEERGFLEQPHVSSGRIPTDRGFRYYVDTLMNPKPLRRDEKEFILNRFSGALNDVGKIMEETSRVLSRVSHYASVVSAPRMSLTVFDRIDMIRLDPSRILVVLVSMSGMLYNRIVEGEQDFSQGELNQASEYLSGLINGLTLAEAKNKILDEVQTEQAMYNRILERIWNTKLWFMGGADRTEVYIDGQGNILDYPEFSEDIEKMKSLLRAFEEKEIMLQLLDKAMEEDGIQVYIGIESQWDDIAGCSLIMSSYYQGGIPLGTLGVIGPKRMDYSRVIPLVEFAAKAVGEKLEQIECHSN